jgi:hypothetical protein
MRCLISLMHGHGLFKIQTQYSQIGTAELRLSHQAGLIMENVIKIVFNMKFCVKNDIYSGRLLVMSKFLGESLNICPNTCEINLK